MGSPGMVNSHHVVIIIGIMTEINYDLIYNDDNELGCFPWMTTKNSPDQFTMFKYATGMCKSSKKWAILASIAM